MKNETIEEFIRKRPIMFLGKDGLISLFKGLIVDCLELYHNNTSTFKIEILGNNQFCLKIISNVDLKNFIQKFSQNEISNNTHHPTILKALTDKLKINSLNDSKVEIVFSIDKNVALETNIDNVNLENCIFQIALLNRKCKFLITDRRHKYLIQNYFHFPEGIFYLFEKSIKEALAQPLIKMHFEGLIDTNLYQIGIAYRSDWYPKSNIICFANDEVMTFGGSLVDGIIDGLNSACIEYVNKNNLINHKITKKKITNELIIVCSVRGTNFQYRGSTKEKLFDIKVKKQAKILVNKLTLNFFENQKEATKKFFNRFDNDSIFNKIF